MKENKDSFIIFRVTKKEKEDFVQKASIYRSMTEYMRKLLKLGK